MLTGVLQPSHLLLILIVALLILGPKKLPAAGRALGQGLREFKGSVTGIHDDSDEAMLTGEDASGNAAPMWD